MKTAVIGVGHLGKIHARIVNENPNVELAAVVDAVPESAKAAGEAYGCPWFTKVEDVLPLIDAAHVVVPTTMHYDVTKTLLKAGKHVLLEKPITNTVAQADELLALAREKGLTLQVGHVERFNPAIIGIQKILKKPIFIEVHRLSPFNPRGTEVSVVFDLMIHDIDIILHLVQSQVTDVQAVGVPVLTKTSDIANVRLSFANGCVANVTTSRISAERMRKIRFFQDDAYISLDYVAQTAKIKHRQEWQIVEEEINFSGDQPLQSEIQSFIDCVKGHKDPAVTGEDGRNALKVATMVEESIQAHLKMLQELRPDSRLPGEQNAD